MMQTFPVKRFLPFLFLLAPSFAFSFMDTSYYQAGSNMFYCSSTTTVPSPTAAGLTNTAPLMLVNPAGSGVRLVVLDVGVDITASPAAAAGLILAYNIVPSSAVASPANGNVTSAMVGISTSAATTTSKASCYVAGTLPAIPIAFRYFGGTTGASAIGGSTFTDPSYPKVVVPPGGILSLQATSATALIADFAYIEVPY